MDDSTISEDEPSPERYDGANGHRHRHRHKRVRRHSGLGAEDYLLFALAVIAGVIVMAGILWVINRPKLW